VLIAVHFTEWNDENHLREAISKFGNHFNYGIDEDTCVYFLNGQFEAIEGNGVYMIENGILKRIQTGTP
jgi:cyanophycinase